MLIYAMLYYIGQAVNAPVWYWVCWGISAYIKCCVWLVKLAKLGRDEK